MEVLIRRIAKGTIWSIRFEEPGVEWAEGDWAPTMARILSLVASPELKRLSLNAGTVNALRDARGTFSHLPNLESLSVDWTEGYDLEVPAAKWRAVSRSGAYRCLGAPAADSLVKESGCVLLLADWQPDLQLTDRTGAVCLPR